MALSGSVVDTGNFANHLETVWSPRIFLDTTEEMAIGNKFLSNSDLDIEKLANGLYIRKVAAKTTNQAAGTAELDSANMSFEVDAETAILVQPTFRYAAAAITKQVQTRYMAFPKYDKAVREQFLRSLTQDIDAECGGLGDNLSLTAIDINLSAALIRQALGVLKTNAQREYKIGKVTAVLRIHNSQAQHLYGIPEITNANLRGGSGAGPNVTGMLVEAWGCDVDITGNITSSGGKRHNMLFLKNAFALAYNEEPQLAKPQDNGLAMLIMAFADAGAAELYDAYAVDIQTDA